MSLCFAAVIVEYTDLIGSDALHPHICLQQ